MRGKPTVAEEIIVVVAADRLTDQQVYAKQECVEAVAAAYRFPFKEC